MSDRVIALPLVGLRVMGKASAEDCLLLYGPTSLQTGGTHPSVPSSPGHHGTLGSLEQKRLAEGTPSLRRLGLRRRGHSWHPSTSWWILDLYRVKRNYPSSSPTTQCALLLSRAFFEGSEELWHRLLRRSASESGTLCHGDGRHVAYLHPLDSRHDSLARQQRKSGAHANCFAGHYSVDIGCPTMMLRGDRVETTSVIANPALFRRSWNS